MRQQKVKRGDNNKKEKEVDRVKQHGKLISRVEDRRSQFRRS